MALNLLTLVHVLISLSAIAAGFVFLGEILAGSQRPTWTTAFLGTTVATSVTGFFFPFKGFTPAIAVGVISLLVLALAIHALVVGKLAGAWKRTYLIASLTALYLNGFVLVAQMFQKIPALREAAPTQSEPTFAITQGLLLVAFILLGIRADARFRTATA